MNLFKKKTTTPVVVKEKTLAEELSSIQSVFRTALVKAQALSSKITAKKEATNAKIAELNAELAEINTVEKNTANFITNIEKFVLSE
jgi:hypothetical protein